MFQCRLQRRKLGKARQNITKSRCPSHLMRRVPLDFFGGSTFFPPKTLNNGALRLIEAYFSKTVFFEKIERDRLVHIENRHGINGSHDHSLSDPKDTARMGYIVNNSDSVDWIREKDGAVKTSKKYRDKNNKPAKLVMVQKKIDGTYCVSDVVPDSKNKTIWVTSARIQKKHQDLDDNNVSPKTTPENALNASDNIIAEETQNVNTSEEITTPALTDKCELHETTHTKTGEALWVISLNDKITSDEYKALSAAVKKVGGYYSRFAKTPDGKAIPGFVFKTEPAEKEIKVFNDLFGYSDDVLNNQTESDIIKDNIDEGGATNGERKETVYLRSADSGGSDNDTGREGKAVRTGKEIFRETSQEEIKRTDFVRHKGDKNTEIVFSQILPDDYTEEMISLAKKNSEINLETVFTDGKIELYDKNGNLIRIIEDGCYNKANRTIYINCQSKEKLENINEHEKVHAFKRINPTAYEDLLADVGDCVYTEKYMSEIDGYVKPYESAYNKKADFEEIIEEILANLSYEIYSDNIPDYVADVNAVQKAYETFWKSAKIERESAEDVHNQVLTDKCELHETTHTKTGEALWVISLNDKITSDEYKALSAAVKKVGSYYSRFAKTPDGKAIPGFVFKTEPAEKEIKVFNDFFGYSDDVLNNQTESDIIEDNIDEGGATNGERKETVYLRPDSDGKNIDDGGRTGEGDQRGSQISENAFEERAGVEHGDEETARRVYREEQTEVIRHTGDKGSKIEFSPLLRENYTEEKIDGTHKYN